MCQRRTRHLALVGLILVCGAQSALADITFWTWDKPPNGHAMWTNPNFRYMIRVMTAQYNSVSGIADAIVSEWIAAANSPNNYSGNAALCLQNWGQDTTNDIWLLDDDSDEISGNTWNIFFANGKSATAAWTSSLVNALSNAVLSWNNEGGNPTLTLDYLYMDFEPHAHSSWHSTAGEYVLTEAMQDSRWDTEEVYGTSTFDDLWTAAGFTTGEGTDYDDHVSPADSTNWEVQNWLRSTYMKIDDALLDEVLYQPMRSAFSGIKCGNYGYFVSSSDTYTNPPTAGSAFTDTSILLANDAHYWIRVATDTLEADVSSPAWYPLNIPLKHYVYDDWWKAELNAARVLNYIDLTAAEINEMSTYDIWLYVTNENIQRAVAAVEGTSTELIPWLSATSESMASGLRQTLKMCADAGIEKVCLFTGQTPGLTSAEWTALNNLMNSINADPQDTPVSSGGDGETGDDWTDFGVPVNLPKRASGTNSLVATKMVEIDPENPNFESSHASLASGKKIRHCHFEKNYGDSGMPTVAEGNDYWDWYYGNFTGVSRVSDCTNATNSVCYAYDEYHSSSTKANNWVELVESDGYTSELTCVYTSGERMFSTLNAGDRCDSNTLVWVVEAVTTSTPANTAGKILWKNGPSGVYRFDHQGDFGCNGAPAVATPLDRPAANTWIETFAVYHN